MLGQPGTTPLDMFKLRVDDLQEELHQDKKAIREVFKLTPRGIIDSLKLTNPIYAHTAYHGHFGREPGSVEVAMNDGSTKSFETFTWERTDKADALKSIVG